LAAHVPEWLPPRTPVTVQCINRSQAKDADFTIMCRAFSREVQRQGFALGAREVPITLTATETVAGRLLVAHLDSAEEPKAAVVAWAAANAEQPQTGRVRVERTILLESTSPVLDFAVARDGQALIALEASSVAVYGKTAAGWELLRREILPVTRTAPRDSRGRLLVSGTGQTTAYLPGSACTSEDPFTRPFSCVSSDGSWNVAAGVQARWATNRNFLQTDAGPVYSIAPAGSDRVALTSIDGTLRLAGIRGEPVAAMAGYGSDTATVEAQCGNFAIVTRAGDAIEGDQLTPVDVRSNRLEAAGSAASVPGPVTALWPSETRSEVHVVVRNAGTGVYEISRAAIHCTE
jgi:hypothetical protein